MAVYMIFQSIHVTGLVGERGLEIVLLGFFLGSGRKSVSSQRWNRSQTNKTCSFGTRLAVTVEGYCLAG